jgi:hypothetical protein
MKGGKGPRKLTDEEKEMMKERMEQRKHLRKLWFAHVVDKPIIYKLTNLMMKDLKEGKTTLDGLIENRGQKVECIPQHVADSYIDFLYDMADKLMERYGIVNNPKFREELLEVTPASFIFRTLSKAQREKLQGALINYTLMKEWPKPRRTPREPTNEQFRNAEQLAKDYFVFEADQRDLLFDVAEYIASNSSGECKRLSTSLAKQVKAKFPGLEQRASAKTTSTKKPRKVKGNNNNNNIPLVQDKVWQTMKTRALNFLAENYPNLKQEYDALAEYLVSRVNKASLRFKKNNADIESCVRAFERKRNKALNVVK